MMQLSAPLRIIVIGCLAITAVGCGGGSDPMSSASSAPPSTTSPASPTVSSSPSTTAAGRLSPSVGCYVDAVNDGELDTLVACFSPDGRVNDVDRPIRGQDEIRTWADNEVIGGRLRVLKVTDRPNGQDVLVHWAPRGSDGWRARYRFTVAGTHITLADLQYA